MKWIMLLWTSFVSFLIAIYAYAWRDMLKTKRVVDRTSTTFRFGLIAIVRATDLKRTNRSSFEVHRNASLDGPRQHQLDAAARGWHARDVAWATPQSSQGLI